MGSIRGVIYDQDFNAPLALAQVMIAETGQKTTASEQGNYVFDQVAPGTYTLIFSKDGYTRQVKTNVVVAPGELTDADASLSGQFEDMEEFVVQDVRIGGGTEKDLLILREQSPALMDSISAELIGKSGAGDVAAALSLVSGATVSSGKFAVIRGLPDRYVSSQINGVRLPSADADTRAVELDQFPTSVVESVQVSKTFTPDQQGDASGGAVNVLLKGIPETTIFEIGVGSSINSQVWKNRNNFLTSKNGGTNFLGRDDGGRDIPQDGPDPRPHPDFSGAAGVSRGDAPVNYDFDMTFGTKYDFDNGVRIGGIASVFYEHSATYYEGGTENKYWLLNGTPVGSPLTPEFSGDEASPTATSLFDLTKSTEEVKWGGLGVLGLETEHHQLKFAYLYTRAAEDSTVLAEDTRGKQFFFPGHDPDDVSTPGHGDDRLSAPYTRLETLRYAERTTQTIQLNGHHALPISEFGFTDFFTILPPEFDWTLSSNRADLVEPDKRQFGSQWLPQQPDQVIDLPDPFPDFVIPGSPAVHMPYTPAAQFTLGNAQRTWKEISEESTQYSLNLKIPFEQWSGDKGYFKFGIFDDEVTRTYQQESFSNFNNALHFPTNVDVYLENQPWDFYWSSVFPSQGFEIGAGPPFTDVDYHGEQSVAAWYYMADIPVASFLRLIGGVRYESTKTTIVNFPEADAKVVLPGSDGGQLLIDPLTGTRFLDPATGTPLGDVAFEQEDILPAFGFVLTPFEQVTLRGSYTETVARQTFKELSAVAQQEFLGGDVFVGNPELGMVALKNYDLRLDYKPYAGSLLSVSWFRKDITNPIEYIQRFAIDLGRYTTPVNFTEGQLTGWEFEIRQDFGTIWEDLEGLSVGANATFIQSNVQLPETETQILRDALAGQGTITSRDMLNAPERLINLFLTYNFENTGTQIGLFYTIKGDTLKVGPGQVDGNFVPAIYAEEHDSLNLTIAQKIGEHIKVKFAVKNLTNPEIREVYRSDFISGDTVKSSYTKGIDFSFGISAEFKF